MTKALRCKAKQTRAVRPPVRRATAETGAQEAVGMRRSRKMAEDRGTDGRSPSVLRMYPKVGSRVTHTPGTRASFRRATATFDGSEFILSGDGTELVRVSAQSGRPVAVRLSDIRVCGGASSDTYMNNPRYVGIRDMGAIPEGRYTFRVAQMATFDESERWDILTGGNFEDPFGRTMHGGDWGAGRVPLRAARIEPSSVRGCGNTRSRSAFYLHGGIMPGSSGCIDVGNDGYDRIVSALMGYRGTITVVVSYAHATGPSTGLIDRFLGGFTYPTEDEPGLLDRLFSGLGQLGAERATEQVMCTEGCDELEGLSRAACLVGCSQTGDRMP